jgi:hypothetical protein
MERLPGVSIGHSDFSYRTDEETKLKILRALSPIHLELTKPLPPSLQRFGTLNIQNLLNTCVQWDYSKVVPVEEFEVGPYIETQRFRDGWERKGITRILPATAFDNIAEYWLAATESEFLALKRRFCNTLTPDDPYVLSGTFHVSHCGQTASDLADVYRDFMAIVGHFARTHSPKLPSYRPSLWHHDFRLANILFDPETFEVKGVIDWESASIVPRVLCARYPRELEVGGVSDDPEDSIAWSYHAEDYTVTFPSEWNLDFYIETTWYRYFYSGLLAGRDVQLSTKVWKESKMALKLSELVDEGFAGWLRRKEWLAETVAKIAEDAE